MASGQEARLAAAGIELALAGERRQELAAFRREVEERLQEVPTGLEARLAAAGQELALAGELAAAEGVEELEEAAELAVLELELEAAA